MGAICPPVKIHDFDLAQTSTASANAVAIYCRPLVKCQAAYSVQCKMCLCYGFLLIVFQCCFGRKSRQSTGNDQGHSIPFAEVYLSFVLVADDVDLRMHAE